MGSARQVFTWFGAVFSCPPADSPPNRSLLKLMFYSLAHTSWHVHSGHLVEDHTQVEECAKDSLSRSGIS